MAIENSDLLAVYQTASGEVRKATVGALLSQVVDPTVPEKIGDLDDVSDTVASDGQVLAWNTTEWAPTDLGEAQWGRTGDDLAPLVADTNLTCITDITISGNFVATGTIEGESIDGGEYS